MYINKNKALSFIEITIAVTILLIVSFASLITVEYRGDKKIYKNTLLKFEE